MADLTYSGQGVLEEPWRNLCELFDADATASFKSIDDLVGGYQEEDEDEDEDEDKNLDLDSNESASPESMPNLTEKANLIVAFSEEHRGSEDYEEFFDYNDLGVPLAISLREGYIKLRGKGEDVIAETWTELCTTVNADPNREYKNLEELISAGVIDIQKSIELNNEGHRAFKSGDAGEALNYWTSAANMGQPNAITSLIWLNIMLNKFDQLDPPFHRLEKWRAQYDALTGDPTAGATQFGDQKKRAICNFSLWTWLSGDEKRAETMLGLAGDGAEPEFLRSTINGMPVSKMKLDEIQVAELIGIYERSIEDFERIKSFDSTVIESWDGKTLAQFAAESIVILREFQRVNMTDTFASKSEFDS
jgi:hypothetical protein